MKVAIVGATGYTGFELVKILIKHSKVDIAYVTSDTSAGKRYSDFYPFLRGVFDKELVENDYQLIAEGVDGVFLCLPHGASMDAAKFFAEKGKVVIDLSADFRISDELIYKKTYGEDHRCPELLNHFAYGIPEIFIEEIKISRLVANPGCYPTSIIIPLYPLLKNDLVYKDFIIADSKSGVSGAGKTPSEKTHYCEVNEDFKPYGIFNHRHNPEIDFILSKSSENIHVVFTPHLLPVNRGILSTIYVRSKSSTDKILSLLKDFYKSRKFVRIVDDIPSLKNVVYTNFIDIAVFERDEMVIIVSAIDNLIKGASGQAVQNLNIINGWDETEGFI